MHAVPAFVVALGHLKRFNHSPGHLNTTHNPHPPPTTHDHLLVTKLVRPQPLCLFCYCGDRAAGPSSAQEPDLDFWCSTVPLTEFMIRLSKAISRACSSRSGIKSCSRITLILSKYIKPAVCFVCLCIHCISALSGRSKRDCYQTNVYEADQNNFLKKLKQMTG